MAVEQTAIRSLVMDPHEMGWNPLTSGRALAVFAAAKSFFADREGFTVGSVRQESNPLLAGLVDDSVVFVAGHSADRKTSGCLELRVSQMTTLLTVTPSIFPENPWRPEAKVYAGLDGMKPLFHKFVHALGRD